MNCKIHLGFTFRGLWDVPETEWTVEGENIEAEYFFRPKQYVLLRDQDQLSNVSFHEFMYMLDPNQSTG